jgi:hypothetical protein
MLLAESLTICIHFLPSEYYFKHMDALSVSVLALCTVHLHLSLPPAKWSGLEDYFLRVVGSIPTQWTSTYVLVGGRWLNKLLRSKGLVDTINR